MSEETVLIVDDRRENIVHLANNVLKPNGYQVITAMDGQKGLKSILQNKPDLVILDLNMPKMDGLEVLAALQEQEVETPVILTTFYGSEQVAEQALRLGAVNYIVKPYKVSDMLYAVEKALADRSPPAIPAEPEELVERAEPEAVIPLTRQVERWMRDMNILTRVGKALVAQLDLTRVCIRTVEAANYVTRADHGFLYLQETATKPRLRLCAARGPTDYETRLLDQPVSAGLAVQVIRSGEVTVLPKAPSDVQLFELVGNPLGPIAAAPLPGQPRPIGALVVARRSGEPGFGDMDAEWLSGLADYVAIAVVNAWRCQERTRPAPSPAAGQQPRPAMGFDKQRVAEMRGELDSLAEELKTATERLDRLTSLLPGE
jgi:CheY-like chemotaxis protein